MLGHVHSSLHSILIDSINIFFSSKRKENKNQPKFMIQIFVIFNYHKAIRNGDRKGEGLFNGTEEVKIINNIYDRKHQCIHIRIDICQDCLLVLFIMLPQSTIISKMVWLGLWWHTHDTTHTKTYRISFNSSCFVIWRNGKHLIVISTNPCLYKHFVWFANKSIWATNYELNSI